MKDIETKRDSSFATLRSWGNVLKSERDPMNIA